jgi:hypothetical protein
MSKCIRLDSLFAAHPVRAGSIAQTRVFQPLLS